MIYDDKYKNNNLPYLYRITFSVKNVTAINKGPAETKTFKLK